MPAKRKPAVTELRRRAERLAALSGSWRSEADWKHHAWQCTKKTLRWPNFTVPPQHLQRSKERALLRSSILISCSMISRCFPARPYMRCSVCKICPRRRSGSAGPRTTGATEPLGSSLGQQCHDPQPKDLQGNLSPRQKLPSLSGSSILTRAVRIILLHLLSQYRTGVLPCWSKHIHQNTQGQEQALHDFCWQGLWHRQCLPWCAVRG